MRTLQVLTGCTAAGKSAWALRWAEARGAEILSCDSLLFYRGMDVGTAKPSPAERARVPHHLVDVCAVTEPMNVGRYAALAREAAEAIVGRGRPVLVVGGSGFYLKSFFAPVTDGLEVPEALRREVEARLAAEGLPALVAELRALNPAGLGALDTANPRRVARALERCRAAGRPLAELAADFARRPGPFADWKVELLLLERPPEELEERIRSRTAAMLAAGLLEEVRALRAQGLERNPSAAAAIGYRESLACLRGELPEAALPAEIARNTRALVKKQRTWFRTQLPPARRVRAED
ncbi:MAG TPA: tRNA (adenosine(37)-N6)-dimethylallyltransferase MiaA [Opitutaceae bacterium]|nr:tRNA (adenosine(37)-N6)-dimethylallyltransferase MiaA [Opitutaceae bacterium]